MRPSPAVSRSVRRPISIALLVLLAALCIAPRAGVAVAAGLFQSPVRTPGVQTSPLRSPSPAPGLPGIATATATPTRPPTATPTPTFTPTLGPAARTATAVARHFLPAPTLSAPGAAPPVPPVIRAPLPKATMAPVARPTVSPDASPSGLFGIPALVIDSLWLLGALWILAGGIALGAVWLSIAWLVRRRS